MDRNAIFWCLRLLVAAGGIGLSGLAADRLGRWRATANWRESGPGGPSTGRLLSAVLATGVSLTAVAALLVAGALVQEGRARSIPEGWRGWLLGAVAALVVLAAGGSVALRLVARVELSALIRTPSAIGTATEVDDDRRYSGTAQLPTQPGAADPAVPVDGQPGWVYRDHAGDWYLAVSESTGRRLVRLADFALVPAGTAAPPLDLVGSVQMSVWPPEVARD